MGININRGADARLVLDSIRRIVRGLRLSSTTARRELGVSAAQLFVLQSLAEGGPLSVNELAGRTMTHQSTVSVVVSRLVEAGLVSRKTSRADGRQSELSLTTAGRALLRKAPPTVQERLVSALEHMPTRERTGLAAALESLVERAGLSSEAPALFFEDEDRNG